ncbi:hypothetical protein AB8O53_17985 [Streptomyces pilosus]
MNGTSSTTATLHGWDELLADPPAGLTPAAGDRIVHGDVRVGIMVRDHHLGVTFVDWAHADLGPACIDAAPLTPQPQHPCRTHWPLAPQRPLALSDLPVRLSRDPSSRP